MNGVSSRLEENKQDVVEMYNNGDSMTTIGKKYDCNSGSVYYKLKEWKISTRPKIQHFEGSSEDYKDQILSMFDDNKTMYQISKVTKININTISKILNKAGRNTSKFISFDPENLLVDKKDLVIQLHNEGKSTNEIAILLGYSQSSVWQLLNNLEFDTTLDTYNVDESYFEKIDTHTKAYILGMIYSDGNIMPEGRWRIALQEIDKSILEQIKVELQYEGPLYYKPPKNEKSQAQWELGINRRKMTDDLLKLGVMPAKSNILKFPTQKQVPYEFIWSFLLGVFDGDGSIKLKNENSTALTLSFTGSKTFNCDLYKLLLCNDIQCQEYFRDDKPYTSSIMTTRKSESIKLLTLMYEHSTISIDRKRKKWEEYKSKFLV